MPPLRITTVYHVMRNLARLEWNLDLINVRFVILLTIILLSCRKPEDPEPEPLPEKAYVKAPSGLNLREQPSQTARIILLIPHRTQVSVLARLPQQVTIAGLTGSWANIEYSGNQGWAFDQFLHWTKPPITSADVVGRYALDCPKNPFHVNLNSDQTYEASWEECHTAGIATGHWSIEDDQISFEFRGQNFTSLTFSAGSLIMGPSDRGFITCSRAACPKATYRKQVP